MTTHILYKTRKKKSKRKKEWIGSEIDRSMNFNQRSNINDFDLWTVTE